MARFLHIERMEETTVAKSKLKEFHTIWSNLGSSSVEIGTEKTKMADFIHTNTGNIDGDKCVVRNDTIYTLHEINMLVKLNKVIQ